jgi:hypothetical protein
LPSATMSFACCGVVIMPTAPTAMSGYALLTASANGTYASEDNKTSVCAGSSFSERTSEDRVPGTPA